MCYSLWLISGWSMRLSLSRQCLLLIRLLNLVLFPVKFDCLDRVIHPLTDQMTRKAGYIFQAVLFQDDQVTANLSAIIQIKIYFNFKGLGFFKVEILRKCRKLEKYTLAEGH